MGSRIAVIGTAGRDKSQPMDSLLWQAMTQDLRGRVTPGDVLISGGAAWADHLAIHSFLAGWVNGLELYLPAPFTAGKFQGPHSSAASAANYYHEKFKRETGVDGLAELEEAVRRGAAVSLEPVAPGYGAMFNRNKKVAKECAAAIAYTFGAGEQPADGGTLNTWRQIPELRHLRHIQELMASKLVDKQLAELALLVEAGDQDGFRTKMGQLRDREWPYLRGEQPRLLHKIDRDLASLEHALRRSAAPPDRPSGG